MESVRKGRHNGRPTIRIASARDEALVLPWIEQRFERVFSEDAKPDLELLDARDVVGWAASRKSYDGGDPSCGILIADAADEALAARGLELGAFDYCLRPLRQMELLARLERAVRFGRERAALRALADTDALTGLANFRALQQRLEHELRRSARYGYSLALVMIDLDHLKEINDTFGHEEGNRAICALAERLEDNLRDADFAARFGGDEFVALLPYQSAADAAVFGERLRAELASVSLQLAGDQLNGIRVSISVGIAATRSDEDDMPSSDALIARADAALYEAKRRGRNRVVVSSVEPEDGERSHA